MEKIVFQLDVDSKGVVQGIRSASSEFVKIDRKATGLKKTVRSLGNVFDVALGNVAAGAIQGATRQLGRLVRNGVGLLNESVQKRGIQLIAERKLEQALRNTGDASAESVGKLKGAARELQQVSNFGDEATLTAQALLLSFKEVGGAEGAELLTHNLADTAAGLAKVTGEAVDLNTVSQAVGRALTQGAGALSRYGVSMTETEKAQFNAAEGMERVVLLSKILDSNFKGLAAATADPFKQLQNDAGDLQETLGEELLPVAYDVANQLRALAKDPEVTEFVRTLGRDIGESIRAGISAVETSIRLYWEYKDEALTAVKAVTLLTVAVKSFTLAQTLSIARLVTWAGVQRGATIAQTAFNVAVGTGRRALTIFNTAVKANPVGLLVSVLTTAATAFLLFRDNADEATDALKDQRDAAIQTRSEIEKLSGAAAGQKLIEYDLDIRINEGELAAVEKRLDELNEQRRGASPSVLLETREEYARLVAQQTALSNALREQRQTQAAVEERVQGSLAGQLAYLEAQLSLEKDKAELTDQEKSDVEAIRASREALRDDASLSADQLRQKREESLELEREIYDQAAARLPQDRIEDLETEAQLVRDQIEARRALGKVESDGGGDDYDKDKRSKGKTEAERAIEMRELEIEAMREGEERVRAAIALEFDKRRAKVQEEYAALTAAEKRAQKAHYDAVLEALGTLEVQATADALAALVELPDLDLDLDLEAEIELRPVFTGKERLGVEMEDLKTQLQFGLVDSLSEVDQMLATLQRAMDSATTESARDEIRRLRLDLEALRAQMEGLDIGAMLEGGIADGVASLAESVGNLIGGNGEFQRSIDDTKEKLQELREELRGDISSERRAEVQALIDQHEAALSSLEGLNGFVSTVGRGILTALADLAQQIGRVMIGYGVAMLALKKVIKDPLSAIAAGTALIALGAAMKSAIQSKIDSATSGSAASGGARTSDLAAGVQAQGAQPVNTQRGAAQPVEPVGIEQRYRGGPVDAGKPYLVGENPDGSANATSELVVPRGPAFVLPASVTRALSSLDGDRPAAAQRVDIRLAESTSSEVVRVETDWGEVDLQITRVRRIQNAAFGEDRE